MRGRPLLPVQVHAFFSQLATLPSNKFFGFHRIIPRLDTQTTLDCIAGPTGVRMNPEEKPFTPTNPLVVDSLQEPTPLTGSRSIAILNGMVSENGPKVNKNR